MAPSASPFQATKATKTPNANKRKSPPEGSTSGRSQPKQDFFQGGDLIFKSVDGSSFSVHSVILSVASPVFADMLKIGTYTSGEIVELAETSEMLDIMLRFIYPIESPTISSFDMMEKAMHIAKKYELEDMQRQLRRELSMPSSSISCHTDPLGAFAFATAHGLKDEIKLSRSIAHKSYQFNTVDDLLKLSKAVPASIPWILLIGVPSVKNKIITTLLFRYHEEPMKLSNCSFLCVECSDYQGTNNYGAPEWLARWAHGLFVELTQRPRDNWAPLFRFDFLSEAIFHRGGSLVDEFDCDCLERCETNHRESFNSWASKVHKGLLSRLACLDRLETLLS